MVDRLEAVFLFKDAESVAKVAAMPEAERESSTQRSLCIGYCVSKGWIVAGAKLNTMPADKAKRIIANARGLHNAVAGWATPKS